MRITGGQFGGRILRVPRGSGVRPTQDRVRQALFSSLGHTLAGCRVLDLFAGTGALGFEALSRGASLVCWVEKDARTAASIRENARHLAPDIPAHVVTGDALEPGRPAILAHAPFDLVLADPPYELAVRGRWLEKTLRGLAGHAIVAEQGLLVYEQSGRAPPAEDPAWTLVRDRRMGDTRLLYYRYGMPVEPAETHHEQSGDLCGNV